MHTLQQDVFQVGEFGMSAAINSCNFHVIIFYLKIAITNPLEMIASWSEGSLSWGLYAINF